MFTELDVRRAQQLLAVLKRAKYEVQGEEVLAVAQVIAWASELPARLQAPPPTPAPKPPKKR